jgi:vancomycin resistance protein YoaR
VELKSTRTYTGRTASELGKYLKLVSQATTYSYQYDPNRDKNMRLICKYISGTVVQPGGTFSYNRTSGERTAARGFLKANMIKDGRLVKVYGGGACQPNSTLFQAVLKADLPVIERSPHSWPSAYTQPGLDATTVYGYVDMKFRNNTDYPVAVVATYQKPTLTMKIYGRPIANGVTIQLKSVHNGYIPVAAPIYRLNTSLAPGARILYRQAHVGQRASAYKVYYKNGKIIRSVLAFRSYYPPIRGIYEVGPRW